MKKNLVLITVFLLSATWLQGQEKVLPNKPYNMLNAKQGYITINELGGAFGVGVRDLPIAKGYFGFTTIHGFQATENFIIGGGTGISKYNGGTFIPLFADLRYSFRIATLTPFVFGDGGFLIDPSNLNSGTRLFVNAGPGVRYAISTRMAFSLSGGLFVQMGEQRRDSYINLKLGIVFKPN